MREVTMLTIFSTPKPFRGHEAIIQRNAIKSWTLLRPDCEIILFGDEEGSAAVANEFHIRHEPDVRRDERGTKYLHHIFHRAQEIAQFDLLCYVNCDIMLMSDFMPAVQHVSQWSSRFLMIGHRWDVDIAEPWDFQRPSWESHLRNIALQKGQQRPHSYVDYFVFPRGTYRNIPPLVIGRVAWDNWLVWKARASGLPVVDASAVVLPVHQNHDYAYHPHGEKGVWHDELAERNRELAGGWTHFYTIADATYHLTPSGIRRNLSRQYWARRKTLVKRSIIDITRRIRHRLGMSTRSKAVDLGDQ